MVHSFVLTTLPKYLTGSVLLPVLVLGLSSQQMSLASLGVATAQHSSLTQLYLRDSQDVNVSVHLPPMELQAFVVTLR